MSDPRAGATTDGRRPARSSCCAAPAGRSCPAAHELQRLGAAVDGDLARAGPGAACRGCASRWRAPFGVRDRRRRHVRLGAARARHEARGPPSWPRRRRTGRGRAARAPTSGSPHGGRRARRRVRPTPARSRPPRRRAEVARRRARAAPVAVETAKPTDSLAREVPLIDEGRATLATAPSRALAALETHRREFPHGQLAAEREFLAVQALLQMNRMVDAKKRAEELASRTIRRARTRRAPRA